MLLVSIYDNVSIAWATVASIALLNIVTLGYSIYVAVKNIRIKYCKKRFIITTKKYYEEDERKKEIQRFID